MSDNAGVGDDVRKVVVPRARIRAVLPPEQPGSRPVLSKAQLDVLWRYGAVQEVSVGDVLFADGDETYDLVVVLEGELEIVEHHGQPGEIAIISYGPLEFPDIQERVRAVLVVSELTRAGL